MRTTVRMAPTAKIALVPFGQEKPKKLSATWEADYKRMREQPHEWPHTLVSFELWCAMTLYDVKHEDGGEAFQKLMHYLLTEGSGPIADKDLKQYPRKHYSRGYGERWTMTGGRGGGARYLTSGQGKGNKPKPAHTSKDAAKHEVRGADVGQYSGVLSSKGFTYASKAEFDGYQQPVARRPYSRANWLQMMSLRTGDNPSTHDASGGFVTDGASDAGQGGKCYESGDCMASGNIIAALYGLYFYPDCRKYDWTIAHDNYTVRMRMWNPQYQLLGQRLFMQEPLNTEEMHSEPKKGQRYVGGGPNTTTEGSKYGMHLPPMMFEATLPMEPNHIIKTLTDSTTRLAPFYWGSGFGGEQAGKMVDSCKAVAALFAPLAHKPEDYLMWGFNCPKAHWLYPHFPPTFTKEELTVTDGATENKLPGNSAYQPWPVWSARWDTPAKRAKAKATDSQSDKHYKLLQWDIPEPSKVDERRKYALGLAQSKPKATQHAPSLVETVAPATPPPDDGGEAVDEFQNPAAELQGLKVGELKLRLADKGLSIQGKKAELIQRLLGTQSQGVEDVDGRQDAEEMGAEQERPEMMQASMADQDLDRAAVGQASVSIGFAKDNALNAMTEDALAENETEVLADKEDESKEHQFNRAAGVAKNASLTALEPGSESTTRDVNPHFRSYNDSPWPHQDIYSVSKLNFVPDEVMDQAALDLYKERYGSTHNLYLRGEMTPKTIKDIEPEYGLAQAIINTKITEKTKVHQKHLCRILAIYFHDGDIGFKSKGINCVISAANKELGMLQGVYGPKDASPLATGEELRLHYGKPTGKNWQKRWELLWGPVFKKEPPEELADLITMKAVRGDDTLLKGCVEGADTSMIESDMTVMEWITTPWHYNFLPYQPEQILFRDGETFSEGCRRCSRPFHEAEHMYMWYRLSTPHTEGWPLVYWRDSTRKGEIAPQPFYSAQFWSAQEKVPNLPPNAEREDVEVDHTGYDEDGGWHNWPTFDFLFDKTGVLADEWQRRFNAAERKSMTKTRAELFRMLARRPANFKRYENLAWSSERAEWWGGEYPDYPQSRCSRGRVKLGMREFKLQRASKYGNTCRDCAATLEYAPGLFKRNHRAVTDIGVVKGREEKQKVTLWWGNLIGRMEKDDGEAVRSAFRFDPDFLHTQKKKSLSRMKAKARAEYNEQFTKGMETLTSYMQKQHETFAMGNRTKHTKEPPDIYIQKTVAGYEDSTDAKDHELIHEAVRDLRGMLNGDFNINTDNQALRDMVYELERKYVHETRFERDLSTRVFDSDMMRLEKRNVTRTKPGGGGTFYNCLETRIYQPREGVMGTPDPEKDYKVCIYYANRKGLNGEECETGGSMQDGKIVSDESMWCGDGFVAQPPIDELSGDQEPNEPYVTKPNLDSKYIEQWRPMRQSRLFITYSLHRPVTSELEARGVLEKMADAAHELFGNDYYLSQLLVFGYKLAAFDTKEARSDTLSKGAFQVISKTNKKDAMANFYGEGGNTSYMYDTYETHVDSVSVDGGMEIGPTRKHPHFHVLLTINHWSYVQIDYFKMNAFLEMMFRGVDVAEFGWGERFKLPAEFYTDAENPYVDIRVYPQDNWQDIIAAYVRKNATPGIFEALGDRGGIRPKPYSDAPAE